VNGIAGIAEQARPEVQYSRSLSGAGNVGREHPIKEGNGIIQGVERNAVGQETLDLQKYRRPKVGGRAFYRAEDEQSARRQVREHESDCYNARVTHIELGS